MLLVKVDIARSPLPINRFGICVNWILYSYGLFIRFISQNVFCTFYVRTMYMCYDGRYFSVRHWHAYSEFSLALFEAVRRYRYETHERFYICNQVVTHTSICISSDVHCVVAAYEPVSFPATKSVNSIGESSNDKSWAVAHSP